MTAEHDAMAAAIRHRDSCHWIERAETAEARVAELEAEVAGTFDALEVMARGVNVMAERVRVLEARQTNLEAVAEAARIEVKQHRYLGIDMDECSCVLCDALRVLDADAGAPDAGGQA